MSTDFWFGWSFGIMTLWSLEFINEKVQGYLQRKLDKLQAELDEMRREQ